MPRHRALLMLCTAALLVMPAGAEEVTVKNDSFQSGGSAFVVGDWVTGERACARLLMPCDGRIVAVQVAWLSFSGGNPPTLGNAIYIFQGANFPTPGPQLAFLEGPILNDGALNEFRYIDEEQTIPLSVPVSGGQFVYVCYEFGEPTNILLNDPTVIRDLDGCTPQRNVIFALPGGWLDFCSFTGGDFVIRAVVDCAEATGACCKPSGVCVSGVEQADCVGFGEVWTQGATCAQVVCEPRGACCRAGGCLSLVSPALCQQIGGVYAGNGSDCASNVCVAGACCSPDGTCSQRFSFQCASQGGVFNGPGSSCSPNPCPQPSGACCFETFCLGGQLQADCVGAGGVWKGALSACTPNPCAPAPCVGDMNCNGQVDFADIDLFVEALNTPGGTGWPYPTCPWLNADANSDGNVTFADIDPFVARIGTTCP